MKIFLVILTACSRLTNSLELNSFEIVQQTAEWEFFELEVTSEYQNQFLMIELIWNGSSNGDPLLMANPNTKPNANYLTSSHTWQISATHSDLNAWYTSKKYHYLQISNLKQNISWQIGVLNSSFIQQEIQYTISAWVYQQPQCPNSCSYGYGDWSLTGKWTWDDTRMDRDCSVEARTVKNDDWVHADVSVGEWKYVVYDEDSGDVEILMEKEGGQVDIYFIAEGTRSSYVPNELDYTRRHQFRTVGSDDKTIDLNLDDYNADRWLIGIHNSDTTWGSIVSIKPNVVGEETQSVLMYVLIALAILVVIMWVILAIVKSRLARNRPRVIPETLDETIIPGAQNDFFNQMTDNFPIKEFKEIKIKGDDPCSICLEQFEEDAQVRELECGHVFHRKCIDVWFSGNTVCCLCKRDYSDPPSDRDRLDDLSDLQASLANDNPQISQHDSEEDEEPDPGRFFSERMVERDEQDSAFSSYNSESIYTD